MLEYSIIFYIFAITTVLSAAVVVFAKNIIYSAISLFITLFSVAALYVLLRADFIAVTQILVYIGGILILIIFGIMLTNKVTEVKLTTKNLNKIPAAIFSIGITVLLLAILLTTKWNVSASPKASEETIEAIGTALLTTYLLPFEVASLVLLVALVGSVMYARKLR